MSDSILKQTLSIKVGQSATDDQASTEEEFIFRVPSPLDKARLGIREASIRRMLDSTGGGWALGLDDDTFFLIRGMALFETLLDRASVTWPFSESRPDHGTAELKVDIEKFPPGKEAVIAEVGRRFQDELDTFHRSRS